MTQEGNTKTTVKLVFEYELHANLQKVWRAVSIPELRANWLPEADLSEAEPVTLVPESHVSYRMRDTQPPFLESLVTFQLAQTENGSTSLTIIHEFDDRSLRLKPQAANSNLRSVMRAA